MQTGDSNFSLAVLTSPSPSTTSFLDRFLTCAPQLRKKGRGVTKGCYQRVLRAKAMARPGSHRG